MLLKDYAVLIADDTESDRFFLKEAFRRHGRCFTVIGEVRDGVELVEYLSGEGEFSDRSRHPIPDVLFLDMRMPRMNGAEVVEWLQTRSFPNLTVAILADPSTPQERERALSLGVKHVFLKSVNNAVLASIVRDLQTALDAAPLK